MIRLWYCPDCGPVSCWNSYSAPGTDCVASRRHGHRREMAPEEVAAVLPQFEPETVTGIAKAQGVKP